MFNLIILFFSCALHAQDFTFLGGDIATGASAGYEQQQLSEPSDYSGLTIAEQKLVLNGAVYSRAETSFSLLARGERIRLGRSILFPNTQLKTPEDFGVAESGFSWLHKTAIGEKWGVVALYGNAGTQIFTNPHPPILGATVSWERPSLTSNRSWIYFVNYSNNRMILNNIPIPGVAYLINEKTYRLLVGVPFFFISWRPDPIYYTLVISPFIVSTDAAWRFWGPVQVFGSGAWVPKSYQNLIDGRDEKLIYDKKELATGLRVILGKTLNLTAAYLHSFDRKFLLGKSITDSGIDSVSVSSGHGWTLKLRSSF